MMYLQDLPPELIGLIKTNLSNRDLFQFNFTCSEIARVELSKNEVSARKCGYHGKSVKAIFTEKQFRCGHVRCFKYLSGRISEIKLLKYIRYNDDWFLYRVAKKGHHKILRALLFAGLTTEVIRSFHNYALCEAAYFGHHKVVKLLLSAGLTVEDVRSANNSALRHAASNGHHQVVKLLLSTGLTVEDVRDCDNQALRNAADSRHHEVIVLLVSAGLSGSDFQDTRDDTMIEMFIQGYFDSEQL